MSIGDLPKFPREFRSRGANLIKLVEKDKKYGSKLLSNFFSTLGTLTVDSSGVRSKGEFGSFDLDSSEFQALAESMDLMLDFVQNLIKRQISKQFKDKALLELFLKIGEKTTRIKVRPLFIKKSKALLSPEEIKNGVLPVIELAPTGYLKLGGNPMLDLLAWYVDEREMPTIGDYYKLKIYRPETIADWFDFSWEEAAEAMYTILPMIHLTRKQTLDRLGKSYAAFWDELFRKCGV